MSRAPQRALVILAAAALAAAALAVMPRDQPARDERPSLLLLTSLPLLFNEDFSLNGGGSKALSALQTQYRLVPIGVTGAPELAKGKLLLMAHPLAQTAENLVALDAWLRAGGRVLLLADPLLEWPSKRPLGDPLRPPPMFMDTGLLAHWGLQLDAPDERGAQERQLGGYSILTVSPGALRGTCAISADRLVAHCRVGKGLATVVADADFLDAEALSESAGHNLEALNAELASLSRR